MLLLLLLAGQLLALGDRGDDQRHGEATAPLGRKWAPLNNGTPNDDNNDNKSHCNDHYRYGPTIWRYGKAVDTMTTAASTATATSATTTTTTTKSASRRHNGLLAAEGNNINIDDTVLWSGRRFDADSRGQTRGGLGPLATKIDSDNPDSLDLEKFWAGRAEGQRVGHGNDSRPPWPVPQPAASEPTSGGHIRSAAAKSISGGASNHSGHVGRLIGAGDSFAGAVRVSRQAAGGGGNLKRQQQLRVASILSSAMPQHQQQLHQHQQQQLDSNGCPMECQCKWRGGKQAADCSARQLGKAPAGLDSLTQVLNLTGNPLGQLPRATFASLRLNNLQRIHLSSCQLESIAPGAFEGLRLVVELELSWNRLSQVPLSQMSQLKLMRKLSMRGNALGALDESTMRFARTATTTASAKQPNSSADALSRLLETFPGLLWSGQELADAPTSGQEEESNFIIRIPSAPVASPPLALDEEDNVGEGGSGGNGNQEDEAEPIRGNAGGGEAAHSLGFHLSQLQELDFGQCKLTYIKWWALENLGQLKRLWLDGNQLSQLSGRLVGALPPGLHQLALEGNPFVCDCRLLALKRWLQATRTPLAAPVRCHLHHHHFHFHSTGHLSRQRRLRQRATGARRFGVLASSPAKLESKSLSLRLEAADDVDEEEVEQDEQQGQEETLLAAANARQAPSMRSNQRRRHYYLGELPLDNFVCPPQAVGGHADAHLKQQREPGAVATTDRLHQLIHYLWPTLVRRRQDGTAKTSDNEDKRPDNNGAAGGSEKEIPQLQRLEAAEAERVTLKCPLIACPGWSVHFVWLADYQGPGRVQQSPVVLYDSRQHRANAPTTSNGTTKGGLKEEEISLQGGRILVEEWRAQDQDGNCFKESQMIIQVAHADDSARYKCVGLNKAGNASLEFTLQVQAASSLPSSLPNQQQRPTSNSAQRDQRANQEREARRQVIQVAAQQQQQQQPQAADSTRAKLTPVPPPPSSQSAWLKNSTTFQVTIVLVSVLMGAVVLAFLLFCIVIYQIKPAQVPSTFPPPSPLQQQQQQQPPPHHLTLIGSPHQGLLVHSPPNDPNLYSATNFHTLGKTATQPCRQVATSVHCDPATGQQAAVQLAGHFYGEEEQRPSYRQPIGANNWEPSTPVQVQSQSYSYQQQQQQAQTHPFQ